MKKSLCSVCRALVWPAFLSLFATLLTFIPGWPVAPYAALAKSVSAQKAKEAPSVSTKSYTAEEKRAYQEKVTNDLNQMQQDIHELRVKTQTIIPQKKRMMIQALIELQSLENVARGKLKALKTASGKDWGRCKEEMDKATADLNRGYGIVLGHLS